MGLEIFPFDELFSYRLVLVEKGWIVRDGPPHAILPEVKRFRVQG